MIVTGCVIGAHIQPAILSGDYCVPIRVGERVTPQVQPAANFLDTNLVPIKSAHAKSQVDIAIIEDGFVRG
jgi:hypothetical protein